MELAGNLRLFEYTGKHVTKYFFFVSSLITFLYFPMTFALPKFLKISSCLIYLSVFPMSNKLLRFIELKTLMNVRLNYLALSIFTQHFTSLVIYFGRRVCGVFLHISCLVAFIDLLTR